VEILEYLEKEKSSKGKIVFVGDGINDAPVLARADIGVAMGGLGSDAAIESADIVIMNDEPSNLIRAINIAGNTKKIIWQNIALALGVKILILLLGVFGIASMWSAVFADVGVTILAVLNATRMLKIKTI
ncbi:MAG: HAD hydrolase family protein, partial [Actinobacteria bacterium]|nr:HAD hydrolase family protein [Actinomycetota bacterium]